jgi:crossover junction endodeoxyribonuclease RuvC
MIIIGIDPGIIGAWAILDDLGAITTGGDLPVAGEGARRMVAAPLFSAVIQRYRPAIAVLERVGAMPRQGIASTFKFGRAVGVIEGVLGALACPVTYVAPAIWKKHFQLGNDKEQSRQRAIEIWPAEAADLFARKLDHGRAEAALIGLWGLRSTIMSGGRNG